MSTQTITYKQTSKTQAEQEIPEHLIYEIVDGKPIYYRGYKDVLNGNKHPEEVMADSTFQGWLKLHLGALLISLLHGKEFVVAGGELGLNLSKTDKRGADLAIFAKENWKLHEHYSDLPPEIIIEIDTKADLENEKFLKYQSRKINDYHNFGVKKVIWIFTSARKVTISNHGESWITHDWDKDVKVMEEVVFNLDKMVNS